MSSSAQLLPAERLEHIRQAVAAKGAVRVAALAETLGVSEVTVRADLSLLEREGFLTRTHGGAVLGHGTRYEKSFAEQEEQYAAQKSRIGRAAAALIEEGDTVIIDVGTTTTAMARHMQQVRNVVVVTSGVNIAMELESYAGITVVVTGGTLRPMQHSLVNPYATLLLSQVNADKLFLGCNGISLEKGITNSNLQEAEVKQAMIAGAKQVIVVADSRKMGMVAAAHVCALDQVDTLVTDTGAGREAVHLRRAGLQVIAV